jgi:hypothetical protein
MTRPAFQRAVRNYGNVRTKKFFSQGLKAPIESMIANKCINSIEYGSLCRLCAEENFGPFDSLRNKVVFRRRRRRDIVTVPSNCAVLALSNERIE